MRKAKLGPKTMVVAAVVLALILVFAVTSTALASSDHWYKFDSKSFSKTDLAKLTSMLHVKDWSKVGWVNFDFKNCDWSKIDWWKILALFHWKPCNPHPSTTCTEKGTTTTVEAGTTTTEEPLSSTTTTEEAAETTVTAAAVETGGGGTAGPGGGIWALGFVALALAGGLGWTALRPATKKK